MRVNHHSMWLPGFGPEPVHDVVPAVIAAAIPQKPLAIEVKQYVEEKTREVWPAVRADLWDRSFSPVERFTMNLAALKAAQALAPGEKPDMATREVLNLFTGWGALQEVFSPTNGNWRNRHDELDAILKDEMASARQAVTTSFFTPAQIAQAIWKGVQRLGFRGGKVLESSAGSGMFLATMPEDVAKRSQITAIDLDNSASKILSTLYGPYGVKVFNQGFEKVPLPQGSFDLVVTNVPFGDFDVPETRSVPFRNFKIHDYFLARAMEVVRPGGLVAVITSSGTMDKRDETVRGYLHTQARLVSAFRLPNTAFKAFAGTEPLTDILFFQKYEDGENVPSVEACPWFISSAPSSDHEVFGGEWINENYLRTYGRFNEWYQAKPKHVLGRLGFGTGSYSIALQCENDGDYLPALDQAMESLPEGIYKRSTQRRAKSVKERTTVENSSNLLAGSYVIVNGKLGVSEGAEIVISDGVSPKAQERAIGMIGIRDAVKALIQAQIESDDDALPDQLRAELNRLYDTFVKSYGPLTNTANTRAFSGDPSVPLLHSLEFIQEDGSVTKAGVFSQRTVGAVKKVTHCDTTEEALPASLAEHGKVDIGYIASLVGKTVDDVIDDMSCKGLIYRNPSNYEWQIADEYLSGDVKTKLAVAELAGDDYASNITALKEVIPADLAPADITARLGSTWIPLADYELFLSEVFDLTVNTTVSYEGLAGSWNLKAEDWRLSVTARQQFGTARMSPLQLFEQALNQQVPTVTDVHPQDPNKRIVNQTDTVAAREKQASIKERFVAWLWEDQDRATRLAAQYNDTFNRTVDRRYNGKHLVLPGFSNQFTLHVHQKDAIWRVVSSQSCTLLAHCVGAGKTLEMICAGQELKRLGIATKPCYVVPNHMLHQFAAEILRAYPNANVLLATKDDFSGQNRRRFLSRIATNNWDAVVITHASFERIKMSGDAVKDYIVGQVEQLEAAIRMEKAGGAKQTVKQLERSKRDWEARLEKLAASKTDDALVLNFEELGVDWLFVDEAHYFKGLYRFSKMANISGLSNSNSQRAFDMYLKVRYITGQYGYTGGVTFATGTPVANSLGELWTMQKYLQWNALVSHGIGMFDSWAANFGEAVSAIELAPDGSGYRMNTRFAKFVNVPELMMLFRQIADIRTADMIKLNVPEYVYETVTAEPSPELKAYVETLVKRAEKIKNRAVNPKDDNMLAITGDGRKAALDMRMIGAFEDHPGSKVNLCVEKTFAIYEQTAVKRLTQVIFLDMGTPGGASFNVYADIRSKLVARGVAPHEIAFAHDAANDAAKEALAKDVRKGKVRIILGSTTKLGVGTNMQDKLVHLHHLDGPWRPADIEQREGRIVRQGNQNATVGITRYVTAASFDSYVWQTLETKAKFIAQIMKGDSGIRTAEDLELAALSYAEVKALASGNVLVLEKAGIDAEVAKLAIMKSEHDRQQWSNRKELAAMPDRLASMTRALTASQMDMAERESVGSFALQVGNQTFNDVSVIGELVAQVVVKNLFAGAPEQVIGKVGNFTLTVSKQLFGNRYVLRLRGATVHEEDFTGKAGSAAITVNYLWDTVIPGRARNVAIGIEECQKREQGLRERLNQPFDKAHRFAELLERQAKINAQLGIGGGEMMATEAA
jgi:N12 class adenine-specific DNA methylase